MGISRETMEKQLTIANVAISNALEDSEIKELLSEFGYTEEKLTAGKALYEKAEELYQVRMKEYGEQLEASADLEKAWEDANKVYMKHLRVCRIALKDDVSSFKSLNIKGARKRSISGWLAQSNLFYTNAYNSKEVMEALKEFGITDEKIKAGKALVEKVSELNAVQKKEMGEAQEATVARDNAFDAMLDWMHDFIEISKVALEDRPQLIERMGILER